MAIGHSCDGELHLNVLVVTYNDPLRPYSNFYGPWNLSQALAADIEKGSRTIPNDANSNRVKINLIEHVVISGLPPKRDIVHNQIPCPPCQYGQPGCDDTRTDAGGNYCCVCRADYNAIIDSTIGNKPLRDRIGKTPCDEIDEVWLWSSQRGGFWEAIMIGPDPWPTNAGETITRNDIRNCVFMGFNYEVGEACMLESFIHRIEGQLNSVYHGSTNPSGQPVGDWSKFTANYCNTTYSDGTRAGTDQNHPAGAGWAHDCPSSDCTGSGVSCDYDKDDPRRVWVRTPAYRNSSLPIDDSAYFEQINDGSNSNNNDWNTGAYPRSSDPTDHLSNFHVWWMYHLPKFDGSYTAGLGDGTTDTRLKNWWEYIFNYYDYDQNSGQFICPK